MVSLCRDHWITHVAYAKVGSVSWENETSTPRAYILRTAFSLSNPSSLHPYFHDNQETTENYVCLNDGLRSEWWKSPDREGRKEPLLPPAGPRAICGAISGSKSPPLASLSANFSLLTFVNVSISIWMEKYWRRRNKELSLQHSLLFKLILLHKQG